MISSWLKQRRIGNLDLQKLNQSCFGEENRQWSTNYNYSQPSNHQMHPLWYFIQRQRQTQRKKGQRQIQILQYKQCNCYQPSYHKMHPLWYWLVADFEEGDDAQQTFYKDSCLLSMMMLIMMVLMMTIIMLMMTDAMMRMMMTAQTFCKTRCLPLLRFIPLLRSDWKERQKLRWEKTCMSVN